VLQDPLDPFDDVVDKGRLAVDSGERRRCYVAKEKALQEQISSEGASAGDDHGIVCTARVGEAIDQTRANVVGDARRGDTQCVVEPRRIDQSQRQTVRQRGEHLWSIVSHPQCIIEPVGINGGLNTRRDNVGLHRHWRGGRHRKGSLGVSPRDECRCD